MKKMINLISIWLLITVTCQAHTSHSFAPPSGKTLLLVGQDRDTIDQYVRATGNTPGGTMFYTSIQELKGLEGPNEYGSGPEDGQALLQSYPNSVLQIGLYMVDGLSDTVAGKYDDNLRKLAQWIKKANRPVYLRIGYEFDNPVFNYDPKLYKQAFRYVVDFLRKEKVRNVAYVWHSETAEESGQYWKHWYPGDDYVDWFAASLFKINRIPIVLPFLKMAREHHKPFMIAESTPQGMYTVISKKAFLSNVFKFIKDNDVEAFCYIDSNWDVMPMFTTFKFGDARLEQYADTKELWLSEINNDRYLKASPYLFRSLGWEKKLFHFLFI